jgi:hypothetical protein
MKRLVLYSSNARTQSQTRIGEFALTAARGGAQTVHKVVSLDEDTAALAAVRADTAALSHDRLPSDRSRPTRPWPLRPAGLPAPRADRAHGTPRRGGAPSAQTAATERDAAGGHCSTEPTPQRCRTIACRRTDHDPPALAAPARRPPACAPLHRDQASACACEAQALLLPLASRRVVPPGAAVLTRA